MKKIIILHIFTFSFFMQAQSFRGLDKSPLDMVNFPASSGSRKGSSCLI